MNITVDAMAETYANKRGYPRRKIYMTCQVDRGDRLVSGRIIDASYGGIGILLPEGAELIEWEARVHISPIHQSPLESLEEITLRARPVYRRLMNKGHHVGFKIEQIECGEPEWKRLCDSLPWNMRTDLPSMPGFAQERDVNVAS